MSCDLHVHSTASDGSLSPSELVELVKKKGLDIFALTDHDTVEGIEEALATAKKLGVNMICGIELACSTGDLDMPELDGFEIHMLGYFNEKDIFGMKEIEDALTRKRIARNEKIFEKASACKIPMTYEDIKPYVGSNIMTKGHMYRFLVENGYAENNNDAIEKFFKKDMPLYVEFKRETVKENVCAILKHKGVPVIAHPVLLELSDEKLRELFEKLKKYGVMGVEAIYVEGTEQDRVRIAKMAKEMGFFITGGSDFHGELKPDIQLSIGKGDLVLDNELAKEILEKIG